MLVVRKRIYAVLLSMLLAVSLLRLLPVSVHASAVESTNSSGLPVVVDYAVDVGPSTRMASGILHGIDYKTPAEWLTDGIYLDSLRGQAHQKEFNSHYEYLPGFLDEPTFERLKNVNPNTSLMIGLYYEFKAIHGGSWQNAALQNNGATWKSYIAKFLNEERDRGMYDEVYSWIPWNEPDLQWGGNYNKTFLTAYKYAYQAVKEFDSSAKVQGPELAVYDFGRLTTLLSYCKENNCIPDVLSWHELTNNRTDIESHTSEIRNWMIENNIAPMPFAITEYQGTGYGTTEAQRKNEGNYNSGLAISYIAGMERSVDNGLAYGLRSEWGLPGDNPNTKAYLGELATFDNATMPTGLWYVYNAYRDMTGRKVQTTQDKSVIDAFATTDSSLEKKQSGILLGNWNSGDTNVTLTLKNIPDYLKVNNKISIKVDYLKETLATASYGTEVWMDREVEVKADNTIALDVNVKGRSAVKLVLTPPTEEGIVIEAEDLTPQATGAIAAAVNNGVVSFTGGQKSSYTDPAQVDKGLKETTYKDTGDIVTYTIPVASDGVYNLKIKHQTGPGNGFMQMYIDGVSTGIPVDLYSASSASKTMNYGNVYLTSGEHELEFKIVGYGKNSASSGYTLTFDSFTLAKAGESAADGSVKFEGNAVDAAVGQTSMSVAAGKSLGVLPEATREGFTFEGWSLSADGQGPEFTANSIVDGDIAVYAQWKPVPVHAYTIKAFARTDNNYGINAVLDKTFAQAGEVVTLTLSSSNDNMSFAVMTDKGENLSSRLSNNALEYTVTDDVTFFVKNYLENADETIKNSSFGAGSTSGWNVAGTSEIQASQAGYFNNYSLKLTNKTAVSQQLKGLTAGKSYTLRLQAKGTGGLTVFGGDSENITFISNNSAYSTYSVRFTAKSAAETIGIKTIAGSVIEVDDFTLSSDVNDELMYFVNAGDINPATLSPGDLYGVYNGVTDQFYGLDPVTGKRWGVMDEYVRNASYPNLLTGKVTWPAENLSLDDNSPAAQSYRFLKDQPAGNGSTVTYKFELENGIYDIEVAIASGWGQGARGYKTNVFFNETQILNNATLSDDYKNPLFAKGQVVIMNGELTITAAQGTNTPCVMMNYIMVKKLPGAISGMVSDGTNPLSGANVSLTFGDSMYTAVTSENGSYSFTDVPARAGYTVTATKNGYKAGSAEVDVASGQTSSNVDIVLDKLAGKGATLTGPAAVVAGQSFQLVYGLYGVDSEVFAQDITVEFDANALELIAPPGSVDEEKFLVADYKETPGRVRILGVHLGNLQVDPNEDLATLSFKAKPEAVLGSTQVVVSGVVAANGAGMEIAVNGVGHTINIGAMDKAALINLIAEAQGILDKAIEGKQLGQYPAGSKAILQAAVDKAQEVVNDPSAAQQAIENAAEVLNTALKSFLASVITSIPGDQNADGKMSIGDLAVVANAYGKTSKDPDWDQVKQSDINGDGFIDIEDLAAIAKLILEW